MIKAIEELQKELADEANETDRTGLSDDVVVTKALVSMAGLLHQLAVKVERLERGREPAPYVPDSEEGGL